MSGASGESLASDGALGDGETNDAPAIQRAKSAYCDRFGYPVGVFGPDNWRMIPKLTVDDVPDLVDRVWHALLDAICEGSLAPGARIMQEEVAART